MKSYPLTTPQQNIWNLQKYYPETSVANVSGMLRFSYVYNYEALNKAVNLLIENNDGLRLYFFEENGEPRQSVMPYKPEQIAEYDMRGKSQTEIDDFFRGHARKAILPENEPVFRFASVILDSGDCGIFMCLHHLICDAWSISLIAKEIISYYSQVLSGEVIPNPMSSYLDAVEAEQKYLSSSQYEKDKKYWDEVFANKPQLCRIKDVRETRDTKTDYYTHELDIDFCNKLEDYCKNECITPAVLIESSVITYLHRTNEFATPVTINIPVLNRATKAEKQIIGMFISTTLLSVPVDENSSMKELCQAITEKHIGLFRHQRYPINHILKDLRSKDTDISGLRDVAISYQNARIDGLDTDVSVSWYSNGHSEVPLCLHIEDMGNTGGNKLHFDFQTAILSKSEVVQICYRLLHILYQIMNDNQTKVKDIQIITPDEYRKVVYEFNDTTVDYPKDKCIHQLFEEQVEKTPDKTAVVFEDIEYSYRQINDMANSLAHILREKGVGRNDIVAIIAKRSYKIIVAQLAILKAGGAFLPIDSYYPVDRINFMLKDASCKVALTLNSEFDGIDIEDDNIFNGNVAKLENINSSEDLCYVIFTSGSTGTPKGSMISHKSLNNFCFNNVQNNMQTAIIHSCSTVLAIGAVTFDISLFEVIISLLHGLTIIYSNETQANKGDELASLISQHNVDCIHETPSKLKSSMYNEQFNEALEQIKVFMIGGEVLSGDLVKSINNNTEAVIFNGYGPTETTMGASFGLINSPRDIHIGKPIANTQMYILDKILNPIPIGYTGELFISGDGVGHGYLNRPKLTAEKFIQNPFIEGTRMYKTGDLARWREDGYLEYIGRIDNQVKIRGLRIELGEIETAITNSADVMQIAVVDKKDEAGRQYICAYYVSNHELDEKELRSDLAKSLPRYMIPHYFIRLESFPTTSSGKTDRKSLPLPDFTQSQSSAEYSAPETEQEKKLIQMLEDVLGITPIGMNDDFFNIGGDSLKAIEFISKAQYEGILIDVQNVFEYPTPIELLKHISSNKKQKVSYRAEDFDSIHEKLKQNIMSSGIPTSKHPLGDVLITGATGWLGAHVLDEFLSSEEGLAYCIVRGKDIEDSERRLTNILKYCFGDKYKENERIITFCADIVKPFEIDGKIDTVIHCAANVKHYGIYQDSYDANVTGTNNIIEFAKEKNARLIHISTCSVSGNSFDNDSDFPATIFDETSLYIGQSLENVYIRSKFEAEVAVLNARLVGLDAMVVRVGNLANRQSDLLFQKNYDENATLSKIKALADFGIYPKHLTRYSIELSPVDETAKALIKLAQYYNGEHTVFHLYNKPIRFGVIFKVFDQSGIKMNAISMKQFLKKLNKTASNPTKSYIYETFINDIDRNGNLRFFNNITLDNTNTNRYLKNTGFKWSKISSGYMKKYIGYFINIGYFGGADKGGR